MTVYSSMASSAKLGLRLALEFGEVSSVCLDYWGAVERIPVLAVKVHYKGRNRWVFVREHGTHGEIVSGRDLYSHGRLNDERMAYLRAQLPTEGRS